MGNKSTDVGNTMVAHIDRRRLYNAYWLLTLAPSRVQHIIFMRLLHNVFPVKRTKLSRPIVVTVAVAVAVAACQLFTAITVPYHSLYAQQFQFR